MTLRSIIDRTNIPLLFTSFTYLALWIIGIIAFVLVPLGFRLNIHHIIADYIILALFYIFSLILPVIGILLYMDRIRPVSKRWYLAIPLLSSIFLLTYLRDYLYMDRVYEISFISSNSSLPFLESKVGSAFVSILFSLSSILFVLSMPDNSRKIMRMPFALSIVMTASITINFLVDHFSKVYISGNQIFGVLHLICILLFGLFLSWFAVFGEDLLK